MYIQYFICVYIIYIVISIYVITHCYVYMLREPSTRGNACPSPQDYDHFQCESELHAELPKSIQEKSTRNQNMIRMHMYFFVGLWFQDAVRRHVLRTIAVVHFNILPLGKLYRFKSFWQECLPSPHGPMNLRKH